MVAKCCIKGCKNEQYPGCEMTFHGFPSDEQLKSKWIEVTKVAGNVKYKKLCPLHFKKEDFITKGTVIRLKPNVVPTFLRPPFKTYSNDGKIILQSGDMNYNSQNYEKHNENTDDLRADIRDDINLQDNDVNLHLGIQPEDNQKSPLAGGIARCKCCLESDSLKCMWKEYTSSGLHEVYGTMLIECFALAWSIPKNPESCLDWICEKCIKRLKDAVSFKIEVLASEQLLSGQLETVDVDKLKQEREDLDVYVQTGCHQYETIEDNDENNDEEEDSNHDAGPKFHDSEEVGNIVGGIEIPIKPEPHTTPHNPPKRSNKNEISSNRQMAVTLRRSKKSVKLVRRAVDVVSNRVSSKRLKISRKAISEGEDHLIKPLRKRITKRELAEFANLSESLSQSIEAVDNNKMSDPKATMVYNGPRELIVNDISKVPIIKESKNNSKEAKNNLRNSVLFVEIQKIIQEQKEDSKTAICEVKEELTSKRTGSKVKEKDFANNVQNSGENRLAEMKKQANNIAIILESTNATPIRRHGGIGYGCCFCSEEFPDAADLKEHTIKGHDVKTKRNYAKGKRPSAYLVKLDITELKCNLCGNSIDSLEKLYDHLIEVHKKLLYRNAKNYIVPFKFDQEELRCLFCEFICNSFKGLLEHMSIHYRNHICEICDAGFLTKNNLFNHAGRHKKGTFKCDYCQKVFDTSSKKAGHQRLVHSSTNGVNRCGYCGEMFGTYRRKEKHLITEHGVTLKKLKCKACEKTFETQTALRIHTKRDHLIERRFKCSVCDKRCFTNVQLMQHTLKHTGVKKFQCTICLKAYGRKSTLREHMRIHENDRRFKCELCGMAFVQKCSWRGHMLSKHGQQV